MPNFVFTLQFNSLKTECALKPFKWQFGSSFGIREATEGEEGVGVGRGSGKREWEEGVGRESGKREWEY